MGDEGVARIGALEHGDEVQALGQRGGHVLEAMHCEVHLARQERFLDLLQEGALPPDGLEPSVLHAIAGGRDDLDGDVVAEGLEPGFDVLGLPEREQAPPRADTDLQ